MFFCHEVLLMLFSSGSSLNYSQISHRDNCRDFQIHAWSCRYLAVDAVCSTFDSVLATLEEQMGKTQR